MLGTGWAAFHEKLLRAHGSIFQICVFPAIIAQIHRPLGNLLNLNYLLSLF